MALSPIVLKSSTTVLSWKSYHRLTNNKRWNVRDLLFSEQNNEILIYGQTLYRMRWEEREREMTIHFNRWKPNIICSVIEGNQLHIRAQMSLIKRADWKFVSIGHVCLKSFDRIQPDLLIRYVLNDSCVFNTRRQYEIRSNQIEFFSIIFPPCHCKVILTIRSHLIYVHLFYCLIFDV